MIPDTPENPILLWGDMRHALLEMDQESIDLIVTDPPYRGISGGNSPGVGDRCSGVLKQNDGKMFDNNNIAPGEFMPLLFRVLRDPGHCYVMTNFINLRPMWDAAVEAGFQVHNLLVWRKNTCTPNRWYMKNAEYTLFLRKGRAFSINDKGAKTVHDFDNTRDRDHPTEKPVDLMRFYIANSSQEGDLVLDPFMGAGSTGVAAKSLGRRFIGIELDHEYAHAAADRLDAPVAATNEPVDAEIDDMLG